ncbi:MAG: glycoside hydrolase family 3 N-terminal domain-containing protein [Bacteroidales bacterium]
MKARLLSCRTSLLLLFFLLISCQKKQYESGQMDAQLEARIDSVMKLMTLEEKVGQMNQYGGGNDATGPTFGARDVFDDIKKGRCGSVINITGADAIRKVQQIAVDSTRLHIPLMFGLDVVHGFRTVFPIPLAEACSWDLPAMEKSARIAALEASAAGLNWTFAPMVDIARDARWGRIMEGAGEDTWYGCRVAEARVKGFQGDNLSDAGTLMATAKHFAAYGAVEAGREYNTVDISERTLREIYLPPFKAAIDAGAMSVMNSFNEIGGVPSTGSEFLQRTVLKGEWAFRGVVVSDWTSIGELINHGVAADKAGAAELASKAGSDIDMESRCYLDELVDLVKNGVVEEKLVNDAVRRILRVKFMLGLFDDPYKYCNTDREKEMILHPGHLVAAAEMAKRSMVLLRNEGQILPLKKDQTIAMIGPMARAQADLMGPWSAKGEGKDVVCLFDAFTTYLGPQGKLLYAKGCEFNGEDKSGFAEALAVARKADVILLTMGESGSMTGEVNSFAHIGIPGVQAELIKELKKLNKPMVLVLFNGRPLILDWESKNIPAILEAWLPGTMGGEALAAVVFGDYNPSGKLVTTFPLTEGQIPNYYNQKNTGRPYSMKTFFISRYADIPNEPVYPFGYGLSYTKFKYTDLSLPDTVMTKDKPLKIKVTVSNTGSYDGEDVVQLYIRDLAGSVTRPIKELKGFQKIMLKQGESREVEFTISESDLRFWDIHMNYTSEPGSFRVFVGTNSQELLEAGFVLK